MIYSTPFELIKDFLERWHIGTTPQPEVMLQKSYEELHNAVRNESRRIGILFDFSTKDFIRAEGSGIRLLGYYSHEWHLNSLLHSIPRAYGWLFAQYFTQSLNHLHLVALGSKPFFSINLPIQDRNEKSIYRAHLRFWVVDYLKTENKPRVGLMIIDLLEAWSFSNPPIRTVGEFGIMLFPEVMSDLNSEMKKQVTKELLSNPQYLTLTPIELLLVRYLYEKYTTTEIADKMRISVHNVNYFKRSIIQKCNANFGHLNDARQWVTFLNQTFDLGSGQGLSSPPSGNLEQYFSLMIPFSVFNELESEAKVDLVVTLDRDYNGFGEMELNDFLNVLKLNGINPEILEIKEGSVRITLKMSGKEAEILFILIKSGKLKKFGVTDAAKLEGYEVRKISSFARNKKSKAPNQEEINNKRNGLKEKVTTDLEVAIEEIQKCLNGSSKKHNDLHLLKGRFEILREQSIRGVIANDAFLIERQKISQGIITFIDCIPAEDFI